MRTSNNVATTSPEVSDRSLLRQKASDTTLGHALSILVIYFGLAIIALAAPLALLVVVWLCMALILAGCLNAAHDCAHGTAFQSRVANKWMGRFWCTVVLQSFTQFKYSHLKHHRFTGAEGDTESKIIIRSVLDYFGWLLFSYSPFRGVVSAVRLSFLRGRSNVPARQIPAVRNEAKWILGWLGLIGICTIAYPIELLSIYWVPLFLFGPALHFLALPEHYNCRGGESVFLNTRTVTSNPFVRFVTWNAGFHVEHHLYPSVPSHNLPAIHERLKEKHSYFTKSYLRFHLNLLKEKLVLSEDGQ